MTTPVLGISEIAEGVASQSSLHNQALRQFEARTVRVLSRTTTAPPGSPAEGNSYIVPSGATGVWSGLTNQIASWIGGVWSYYTPVEGVVLWVNDSNNTYAFDGSAWVLNSGSGAGTVTSIALTAPSELSVAGSPITTSGTLAITKANQTANTVWAGPTTGSAAQPAFRALVANDYVTMVGDSGSGGTKGAVPAPGAGDAAAGKFLKADGTFAVPAGTSTGDVVGPGSAISGHVATFNGGTGKLIQDSGLTLAGTNTGDQTITLTGDVTGSGTGSFAATIPNDAVTYAKMQNVSATAKILGRKTSGSGDVEECSLSDVLDLIGSAARGDILYRGSSAWARLGAGTSGQLLETQGASADPTWQSQPFDLMAFYPGVPTASALVTRVPVARVITFPSSLTGSYVKAKTAATAQTDFDLQLNGSSVGTIRFAASGTVATFVGVSTITTAAGDLISIIAPATPDASLADIGFCLAGSR